MSISDYLDSQNCLLKLEQLFTSTVNSHTTEGPLLLKQLYTEGFGLTDIWEQLQLLNKPLLTHLRKKCNKTEVNVLFEEKTGDENEENYEEREEEEFTDSEMEIEEEAEEMSEEEMGGGSDYSDDEDLKEGGDKSTDQFFNLSQMEEFLKQGDVMNIKSANDDIDLFDSDAGEEEREEEENSEEEYQYYNDFFDPPATDDVTTENKLSNEEEEENLPLSVHQKRQQKMKSYITDLETANISDKPWQMTGEVASSGRGENTLLEEDLLFEDATRPAPEITDELTITLEDIIRQRIHDKTWDDVIRRTKPKERPFNYKSLRPLNDEKSKLSLAEVYEEEYLKQTQVDKKQEENPKHKEISELLKKLYAQLDALSNYHFTPSILEPEVKTIPLVPSLAMEEVTPLSHSDTNQRAPEEHEAPSHSAPLGTTERTSTDKLRERRKKKKLQHFKGIKSTAAALKKRKEQLKKGKQNKTGTVKSSGQFFAKLEREVKESVAKKRKKNLQIHSNQNGSVISSRLKL